MRHTGGKTILVVEDERIVAKELQRSLASLGYSVPATAASATDAIRLTSQTVPDLVLMDIQIEGDQDGIQIAETLRARFDVPVIFLTAYADAGTIARAKISEPHGYLVKPVKDADLLSAIEIVLHKTEVERRLRQRERWFATILRAIGDGVIATSTSGAVTFMNLAAERLAGVREEDALGRDLAEVFCPIAEQTRQPLPDLIARVLDSGADVSLPEGASLVAPAGERPIEGFGSPLIDDRGHLLGAVLAFRDVGEQRRLRQQIVMTDRLSSLGTLASGMAHEINNPLTAVIANAGYVTNALAGMRREVRAAGRPEEVVARIADQLDPLLHVLAELRDGADRVRQIVSDLQTFSRPQQEPRGPIELRPVVEWAVRMTAAEVRPRACLVVDLDPVPPVVASEVRLGQVLVNLLVNAAQAIAAGRPEHNEVHVSTSTDEAGRAVVTIRDTGCGMAPEVVQRVFDPFFTTKPVGLGSGLGLSISHGIVRSFGGEITIESQLGAGSTFRVILPAAPDDDDPAR